MDTTIVEQLITGRVQPHIYAYRTGTIPNYLKVGDTYRPVEKRLDEWKTHYRHLEEVYREEASVSEDVFFRDYSIHQFLENELDLHRLQREEIPDSVYYSNEFFRDATKEDVESAIDDIKTDFITQGNHYHYYRFDESRIPVETHYARSAEPLKPRKEQQDTVDRFLKAQKAGRKNLLMYAVMRFGKSFTSMLCAKAMDAKLVVVLCGKTSVEDEWKINVERPKNFEGYSFKTRFDLDNNHHLISQAKKNGERIVLFLTLQDLAGEDVKERHKELFKNRIDLVIIDETHFGARAPEYGKVLQDEFGVSVATGKKEAKDEDDIQDIEEALKLLKTNIKLHLSGTPYRILMGSEFSPEDVIAFYQFTDIVDAQKEWDNRFLDAPDKREWDNPYYGFPQMIRFAFNPSLSARQLIKELKESGKSCALSALFEPLSITKDTEGHYQEFKHTKEILELMEVIDGSREDDELFGFLNSNKIKEGQMCHHMVFVLPFRASCDALQRLIESNQSHFKNLSNYTILNIAGHNCPRELQSPRSIKEKIKKFEQQGQKTITLTVNKMLTGSTVEYWDTILFFKDTASPQEYDQAVFRVQNPYVKEMKSEDGDVIMYNMKPQTLLVDFDVDRLFQLQALKSQVFDANIGERGNAKLEERMRKELEVSPIIVLNKDQLKEVESADIMQAISDYSKSRSVADEAKDIPVDMRLINDPYVKALIDKQGEISSREGLLTKPVDGDGDDFEPDNDSSDANDEVHTDSSNGKKKKDKASPEEVFKKKFATYYSRILFFTFLSKDAITNISDVISSVDSNEDNIRIAKHLELKKSDLCYIQRVMDANKLGSLEFKILNLNRLDKDEDLTPLERAKTALRRFSRLSEAEITTPDTTALKVVSAIPLADSTERRYLDISAKQGEFAIALIEKYGPDVKDRIWSLPTSGVAYEFTRKIYDILACPIKNVFLSFNAFDLIDAQNNEILQTLEKMHFDVIVGNPPYQIMDGGASVSAKPIYHHFVNIARQLNPQYISLIMPSRWFVGGKGLDSFRENMLHDRHIQAIYDYEHSSYVFPGVDIAGGVCYFLWNRDYDGPCSFVNVNDAKQESVNRYLDEFDVLIRQNKAIDIVKKIQRLNINNGATLESRMSARKPFGIATNYVPKDKGTPCWFVQKYGLKYADPKDWTDDNNLANRWKLLLPIAPIAGQTDFSKPVGFYYDGNTRIAKPGEICTESWFVAFSSDSEEEVKSFRTYLYTKVVRFLLLQAVISQHVTRTNFCFVPDLGIYKGAYDDKVLCQLWGITEDEWRFIDSKIKSVSEINA